MGFIKVKRYCGKTGTPADSYGVGYTQKSVKRNVLIKIEINCSVVLLNTRQ